MKKNAQVKNKKMNGFSAFDGFLIVFFCSIIVITLYPFLNVLAMSFNDALDTIRGMNFLIPRKFTLENYIYIFTKKDLFKPLGMSVLRTVIGTGTSLFATAMLAFVLSRKDFYFNKVLTIIFVITMYIGGGLVPEYLLIMRSLKLGNNFLVYIIPGIIGVYNLILIRSYIEGLPFALQEAANIDGASDFTIWYKIIMPLCMPVLATVALFNAVGQWNAFMDTYLYARDLKTLQYILYEILNETKIDINSIHTKETIQTVSSITPQSIRMAITIIATAPILMVYPFLQKYFVGGMTLGAVKD